MPPGQKAKTMKLPYALELDESSAIARFEYAGDCPPRTISSVQKVNMMTLLHAVGLNES
jgi:hypothetical protein